MSEKLTEELISEGLALCSEMGAAGIAPSPGQSLLLLRLLVHALTELREARKSRLSDVTQENLEDVLKERNEQAERADKAEAALAVALTKFEDVHKTCRVLAMLVDEQGSGPMAAIGLSKDVICAQDAAMEGMEHECATLREKLAQAERELAASRSECDVVKRMYCERGRQPGLTPRMIAEATWPSEAERLVPKGGTR